MKSLISFRAAAVLTLATITGRAAFADQAVAWGANTDGQLGNGTTSNQNVPTAVTFMTSGVSSLATGLNHSLAIQNGAVYAWGDNHLGELGDGTNTNRTTPVPVLTLTSGVTLIAAGGTQSLAVQNGALFAWGDNSLGQLGDGTTTSHNAPEAIAGFSSGVTSISGGYFHSLAVKNGAAYAWGNNLWNQLGDGTFTQRNSPTAVVGLTSGVTAVAAGAIHSLALKNGAVYAWGDDSSGQLGNGISTGTFSTPQAVTSLSTGVTYIAGGGSHSLAVQNGGVYAWGLNSRGELGDGTTTNHSTPERIDATDLNNIIAVAAGLECSYALSSDGSLWVWGDNSSGQLGLGSSTSDYLTPQHLLPPVGYSFSSIETYAKSDQVVATLVPVTVPEPASLTLLLPATALLLRRRKKV